MIIYLTWYQVGARRPKLVPSTLLTSRVPYIPLFPSSPFLYHFLPGERRIRYHYPIFRELSSVAISQDAWFFHQPRTLDRKGSTYDIHAVNNEFFQLSIYASDSFVNSFQIKHHTPPSPIQPSRSLQFLQHMRRPYRSFFLGGGGGLFIGFFVCSR